MYVKMRIFFVTIFVTLTKFNLGNHKSKNINIQKIFQPPELIYLCLGFGLKKNVFVGLLLPEE